MTKFEGSYVGHTFVARLASDPKVIIDTFTLQPTRIVDCPNLKEKVAVTSKIETKEAEAVVEAQGTVDHQLQEVEGLDAATPGPSINVDGAAVVGGFSG